LIVTPFSVACRRRAQRRGARALREQAPPAPEREREDQHAVEVDQSVLDQRLRQPGVHLEVAPGSAFSCRTRSTTSP
jgi:hypothetical protein